MITFNRGNMPVQVAAEALKMDPQTIRVMLQLGIVSWGQAWKTPGSRHFQYFISPLKFYESTGYLWKDGLEGE